MNIEDLTEEEAKKLLSEIKEAAENSEDAGAFNLWVVDKLVLGLTDAD